MVDKVINCLLIIAIFAFCYALFWNVQLARNFEIVGGEWILLFLPVAIGFLIFRKKKG
jgi:hypothetical protein